MARYVAWRLAAMLVTIVVSLSVVFFGMALVPGDSAQAGLGESSLTEAQLAARRADFGLDRPIVEQYVRYMGRALRGDFGTSWMSGQSVTLVLGQQLGATAALTGCSLLIAVLLGIPAGIFLAYSENAGISIGTQAMIAAALSTPVMISGTLLVLVFAVSFHWFPATGQGTFAHLILPSTAIGLNVGGSLAKAVEAGLVDVRHHQFALFARAKGLSTWQTLWRHVLRVGLLPVLEMLSIQTGYLFTGTVITENLFARQGLGRLLVAGILNKDVPVVLGVTFASIVVYSVLHFVVEIGYVYLDPRVRTA